MAANESFLPIGTLIASTERGASGVSSDNIPQRTIVNFEPVDASLELQDQPLLIPRITTAERDALNVTHGMIIYNTSTGLFEGRDDNATWIPLGGGGGGGLTPVEVNASPVQMLPNHMYIVKTAGQAVLNMPNALGDIGDTVEIIGNGAGGWQITLAGLELIDVRSGAQVANGPGGTITGLQGDTVIIKYVGDNEWQVSPAPFGNLIIA
jgi:hypothetical protein